MSVLPEIILQRAIMNGFDAVRKDPRIVNMIFKNLPIEQQEAVKRYLLETAFNLAINYPKDSISVPSIIMLMKSETESQQFLSNLMGAPPNYDMPDQDMELDTLGGSGASISDVGGLPDLVLGGLHVLEMLPGRESILVTEESQIQLAATFSERSTWPALNLHVVQGAGVGKVYRVCAINDNQLDIHGTFELDLDSSSVVDIRLTTAPEAAYGNPVRAYEADIAQLRIGANYDSQYQLDILAGNQEEVIYLYAVLKAILLSQLKFLEAQGIMSLKISGTDLAPRSELLPDEVFTRSMTIQFTHPFSFIVEQEVARAIQVVLTNVNPLSAKPYPGGEVFISRIEL